MEELQNWRSTFVNNYRSMPLIMKIFLIFCYLITLLNILELTIIPERISSLIIPFTGWSFDSPYFMLAIILTSHLCLNWKRLLSKKIIYLTVISIIFLLLRIYRGVEDLNTWEGGYEDNPYLYRHPLRYIWTITIPAFWIVMMIISGIKEGIKKPTSSIL
jgi:hypothetical protein